MNEEEIRAKLRAWVSEHAKVKNVELDDQTLILETGLISSLDIVEFVLYLEELRGDEIDTDEIEPSAFANIDSLYAEFFAK